MADPLRPDADPAAAPSPPGRKRSRLSPYGVYLSLADRRELIRAAALASANYPSAGRIGPRGIAAALIRAGAKEILKKNGVVSRDVLADVLGPSRRKSNCPKGGQP